MTTESETANQPGRPDLDETGTTHFGFDEVPLTEKGARVRALFRRVAARYDLMNDLMSGGVHRLWKDRMVARLNPRDGERILDVAGGTGDIAFRMARRAPGAEVVVLDLTPEMLAIGRDRALDRGLLAGVSWVGGDAQALPLPDRSLDAYTVAFGLRNVTAPERALAEAHRVLKPGGRFLCLEFSQVVLPLLNRLYDVYSFRVLPVLGRVVARDREGYRYLVESIRRFPPQAELAGMMQHAGFRRVAWQNLTGGIAALHYGRRL
ncbi:MAG: bifunctional demethylmenaquinone methyltransferase/2-methoxy-6-polyprenyl-1,4-benzoquinol methylase UbiE [Rhodospirillales bacterium]|nr:bifunctional demethylmenaquinone methyltransferase/2-methoxy-6-polyprenyl-1,4-benzoquinol methylase UbiE [Rhodospirillales bacterium]